MKKIRKVLILSGFFSSLTCFNAFANSYWWVNALGDWGYSVNEENIRDGWYWIDGNHDGTAECYFFQQYSIAMDTTTPDGYQVNILGEWTANSVVQTKPSSEIGSNYISYFAYDFGQATPIVHLNSIPLADNGTPSNKSIGKTFDTAGWNNDRRYYLDNGTYYMNQWAWINGRCYYFDENGVSLTDTVTPDGYQVNGDGQWIENGEVQKKNI